MPAENNIPDGDWRAGSDRYPWAGPVLFTVVLVALFAFFWWFV